MDPFSIAFASLGLIFVAKDLADIANATVGFGTKFANARTHLEAYCKEIEALEALPDVSTNDPAVRFLLDCLNRETTALKVIVDGLKKDGIRSRLKFAFQDKELVRILGVIERAKGSLQLAHQLWHAAVVNQRVAVMNERMQALMTQNDALQSSQRKLVSTTTIIQSKVQQNSLRPWLQSLLCALPSPITLHYAPVPLFVRKFHDKDSEVVRTVLRGTKFDVVKLLKSGEAHVGDTVVFSRFFVVSFPALMVSN